MMTNEEALKEAENMALFSVGHTAVVMPIEKAMAAMLLFREAKYYESHWADGKRTHHVGGNLPDIALEIMSSEVYVEGLVNGARKRE
jgi:hypothetical protein